MELQQLGAVTPAKQPTGPVVPAGWTAEMLEKFISEYFKKNIDQLKQLVPFDVNKLLVPDNYRIQTFRYTINGAAGDPYTETSELDSGYQWCFGFMGLLPSGGTPQFTVGVQDRNTVYLDPTFFRFITPDQFQGTGFNMMVPMYIPAAKNNIRVSGVMTSGMPITFELVCLLIGKIGREQFKKN